jgi:hypothetical protein
MLSAGGTGSGCVRKQLPRTEHGFSAPLAGPALDTRCWSAASTKIGGDFPIAQCGTTRRNGAM